MATTSTTMTRLSFGSSPLLKHSHSPRPGRFSLLPAAMPADTARRAHPSLEVLGGAQERFLPPLEATLAGPYRPFPLLGWGRHAETIFAAFFRSVPDVRLRRQCLRTADGGSVALDWVAGDDRSLPDDAPLLILLVRLSRPNLFSFFGSGFVGALFGRRENCMFVTIRACLFGYVFPQQKKKEKKKAFSRVLFGLRENGTK